MDRFDPITKGGRVKEQRSRCHDEEVPLASAGAPKYGGGEMDGGLEDERGGAVVWSREKRQA